MEPSFRTLPEACSNPAEKRFHRGSLGAGGEDGPAYVIYDNYRTILKWNRSNYFAVSVGYLADLIGAG